MKIDPEDYYTFDVNKFELTNNVAEISPDEEEEVPEEATFIVSLTGTSVTVSGEEVKHKLVFSLKFVKEKELGPQPTVKPYISKIDS